MKTKTRAMRQGLLAGGIVLAFYVSPAAAEQKFFIDASAGIDASTNPFLLNGGDTSAASAFVQLAPQFSISDEVSKVTVDGALRYNRYSRLYDGDLSGSANVQAERSLSPLTTLRARASARVSRNSAQDFLVGPSLGQPDQGVPVLLPDVTFAGVRSRTTIFDASVGLEHQLNARDRFNAAVATASTQFSAPGQRDYRYVTGDIGINRTLSERTSAFAALRVGYSDFLAGKLDDGVVFEPTVGIRSQLNPRLSLDAGLGVSLSRINALGGRKDSRLGPAGRIALCETNAASRNCLRLSRASQPTATNGLTTVSTASVTRSQTLGQFDQLVFNANYTRSSQSRTAGTGRSSDFLGGSVSYEHRFEQRFSLTVSPSYSRLVDSISRQRSDIAVQVGIRYRFGSEG